MVSFWFLVGIISFSTSSAFCCSDFFSSLPLSLAYAPRLLLFHHFAPELANVLPIFSSIFLKISSISFRDSWFFCRNFRCDRAVTKRVEAFHDALEAYSKYPYLHPNIFSELLTSSFGVAFCLLIHFSDLLP